MELVVVVEQSGKMKEAAAAAAEVDVQQLGKQAVVKVVCNRRRGHVLRVLNALEECKVEVLQSNVMTVADNSIHFATVQVCTHPIPSFTISNLKTLSQLQKQSNCMVQYNTAFLCLPLPSTSKKSHLPLYMIP